MSEFPSPSAAAKVRDIILAIFDMSEEEAQEQALGLIALAEGWGPADQHHDWPHIIKKRFGETHTWRREAERVAYYSEQDSRFRSYENYIQRIKRS